MIRAALVAVLPFATTSATAAPCRDEHGKFMKCPAVAAGPVCKVGKPCGHSCIARDKVCHK